MRFGRTARIMTMRSFLLIIKPGSYPPDHYGHLCAQDPKVKAIFNSKNFGQFNSPYYGMIHTGDYHYHLRGLRDPVEMIPKFVAEWEKRLQNCNRQKDHQPGKPCHVLLRDCYYKTIKKMSNVEMIEQFTGFGLYDKSFIQTLRDLRPPFCAGLAELGPERKEIEYPTQAPGRQDPQQLVQPV